MSGTRSGPSGSGSGRPSLDGPLARLLDARGAVALTGAGVSVESGIPDFRSEGGLWSEFPPQVYATIEGFLDDPDRSWRLFRALGRTLEGARPNPAHEALARLERAGLLRGVVTQNIDGLHQAAGSECVLEVHGSHRSLRCVACDETRRPDPGDFQPGPPPACPRCDGPLKPDVVLFGETIRCHREIDDWLASCDCLLVVGTSASVYPVADYPRYVLAGGGSVLEFNREPTPITGLPGVQTVLGLAGPRLREFADRAVGAGPRIDREPS